MLQIFISVKIIQFCQVYTILCRYYQSSSCLVEASVTSWNWQRLKYWYLV